MINCDCTLMGGNNGRCPIANMKTFLLLSEKMSLLYDKMSLCHTSDRDNLVAYGDCAPTNGTKDADWKDAVTAKLNIEIYAQRTGDYQSTCLEKHYPHSLTNYLRTYYTFENISSFLYSVGIQSITIGIGSITAGMLILSI